MTVTALKHQTRTIEGDPYWIVLGPHGAISWHRPITRSGEVLHGPIGIHSPRPLFAHYPDMHEEPYPCGLLEMSCYPDYGHLAGEGLGKAWESANRDDQIIWAELEDWYRSRLATLPTKPQETTR